MSSDYSIPIIQGTPVPPPGGQQYQQYAKQSYEPTSAGYSNNAGVSYTNQDATISFGNPVQHQQQSNQFRDVIWAILFLGHLAVMFFLISANLANGGEGGDAAAGSFSGIYTLIAISAAVSIGFSTVSIALMTRFPTEMVKAGLIFSVALMGAVALSLILAGGLFGALFGVFMFAITAYYVKIVWQRIPFAASEYASAPPCISCLTLEGGKFLHPCILEKTMKGTHHSSFIFYNLSQSQDRTECRQIQHGSRCYRISHHGSSLRLDWLLVGWHGRSLASQRWWSHISSFGFILLDFRSLVQHDSCNHCRNRRNVVVCSGRSKRLLVDCPSR